MSKIKTDIDRIREGGATTSWNGSSLTIMRVHECLEECNRFSGRRDYEGVQSWINAIHKLDREIDPFLNTSERSDVSSLRVWDIPFNPNAPPSANMKLIQPFRKKADAYERKLRFFQNLKGLGIRATEDDGDQMLE